MFALACGAAPAAAQTSLGGWQTTDVGAPVLSGSASASGGTFTVDAGGVDIWDTADQFHYVYQAVSGDVDIRARISSLTTAHAWSKAGVMIRGSLSAGAAHGYALVSASRGTAFQRRRSAGGLSTHTEGAGAAVPRWVRLVRVGTSVTAYESSDGTEWTRIGTDTVAFGATVYVGLAVSSHHPGMRTTATFAGVSITPLNLPGGQRSADIGRPAAAGSTSFRNGVYTITGGGRDIWDSADEFHYVYQPVRGDVEVIARVNSLAHAHPWSKAGVMIRESLSAGSRHAYALISAGRGYAFQRRPEPSAWSEHTAGTQGTAPGWVRLVRRGSLFEAFQSHDAKAWSKIHSQFLPMADSVYVGLAVTSHAADATTTAVIDQVRIVEGQPPSSQLPVVSLSSPSDGAVFTAPATIPISAQVSSPGGTIAGVEFFSGATLVGYDATSPYSFVRAGVAAGTYTLSARAINDRGETGPSAAVTVTVGAGGGASPPRAIAFTASQDHHTLVSSYRLEVHPAGATPGSSTPVSVSNLGKPQPTAEGEIQVERAAFFEALQPGSYLATVTAIGSAGASRSAAVTFTR